jgi:hypothetical protein
MTTPDNPEREDEQIRLEIRDMAELLLDVHEYRLRNNARLRSVSPEPPLDSESGGSTIKERSKTNEKQP